MNIVERLIINNNDLDIGDIVIISGFVDIDRKEACEKAGMHIGRIFKIMDIEECNKEGCISSDTCTNSYYITAISIGEFERYAYSCSCKFIKIKK